MNTMYYVQYMYRMYLVCVQYGQSMYSKLVMKILKIPKPKLMGKIKRILNGHFSPKTKIT